ncbi:MAG: DUF1983 domain-containing protein [Opitutae bacterium]|nr:DUF1983 domain-containing protein [Opitutae bacterium]
MSWGKANIPTKSPKTAGVDGNDFSTNEQAVPVKWLAGLEWCPLTWIVDKVYNQRTEEIRQKAGKGKETTTGYRYYGDVAGIACLGLADKLLAFESGNEVVWTGSSARPDDPLHPDYWRAQITTPVAKLAFYWGRSNQPVDDLLLAGIGAADPTLAHPAYRHQSLCVLQNYFFGENSETVPSSRVLISRAPRPSLGNFPPQFAAGGESMIAAILELATNPVFGAGIPLKHFQAGEWEALSAEVLSALGGMSPSLDRSVPLRDAVKDFQTYYDGWTRFENGRIKPGRFPHDGSVPAGLTELSVHDFIDHPDVRAGTPSSTVNDVRVVYRDKDDLLKKKPASASAAANVKARKGHEPRIIEMPALITFDQAARFAAEAAATGAEGEWGGEGLRVRAPRAKWAGGARLQAGDNFNLDLIAPQVDQVSRIMRRVDFFRTQPTLDFIAERGVYPTPYVPPSALRPDIGKVVPLSIAQARVLELTPELAGTPIGLPVAFLAKRPRSEFEGAANIQAANVIGFNVWYGGATGASYDTIGHMPGWGVRGTLREALANDAGDVVVKMAMDADNLDLGRLAAQSAQGQLNDNLLIVVGAELFSVGAITIAGLNYDLSCKRVRLGSLPAAHALGAEAWVVWRDELRVFIHKGFVEDQDRYFKLQPYTQTALVELADVDALLYHFRDRSDELPVIVLGALPATPVAGVSYTISGQISDVNGDLVSYQVQAVKLVASGGASDVEITLQAGDVKPDSKALMNFKAPLSFPVAGFWVIVVRAYDERSGFKELKSAETNVAVGLGATGPDDGVTPDPIDLNSVVITSGVEELILRWGLPGNTPMLLTRVYESATGVRPALPTFIIESPQDWLFRPGLAEGTTRSYWFEPLGKNGRLGPTTGPKAGTVVLWPRIGDIEESIAGKITRAAVAPADPEVNDLWVDTGNGNLLKVWDGAAWQASRDALLTALNSTVTDPSTGLAKTRADLLSGGGTWADADSALAVLIATVDAAADTAQGTANAAVTAAATAQAGVNSVAAEYVLRVETNAGGQRRIAGIRITNQGGAGGATDIVLQADKVAVVNSTGDNQRAPFAVIDGFVYIDTALIRNATITNAMISSLLADKIDAGTLNAMILLAAKTASNSSVFNAAHGVGSTMPAVCAAWGDDPSNNHNVNGTEYISLLTVYGWATGSGFAKDRFAKSDMVFVGHFYGAFNIANFGAGLSHADIYGVFKINGGSWQRMAPGDRATSGDGGANTSGAAEITGLAGTDVIEFGIEIVTPANQNYGYSSMTLSWGNL